MTALSPETLQALAEALAPPTKQLAAGLLRRPLPEAEAPPASIETLAQSLADLLADSGDGAVQRGAIQRLGHVLALQRGRVALGALDCLRPVLRA